MSRLAGELMRFVAELRAAGVRVSVAESIDAMNAVGRAGIARGRMREALAAALVKDEADRPVFDRLFESFFRVPRRETHPGKRMRAGEESSAAPGAGLAAGESFKAGRTAKESRPNEAAAPKRESPEQGADKGAEHPEREAEKTSRAGAPGRRGERGEPPERSDAVEAGGGMTGEAGRAARLRALERMPFARYSDLEYGQACDALAAIARRIRVRMGRRLKHARAGRLDFRRTIRASIQRGGALGDLRFRARRPRHIDLLILADVSGSVRYAAELMLKLVAGAHAAVRRVRSFVYVDRLAEADFEQGHLVMTPVLDLYARSDFGRVLAELLAGYRQLLNRATVVVVMGDGRNNRRAARADLLREVAHLCRAVLWLIPEERERWGGGDSAIFRYAREVTALLPAQNLHQLEDALLKVA
jgi:uncharacterized protein